MSIYKLFFIGVVIIIVLGIVSFGLIMIFRPAQIIEKVTEPDRVIYSYEWFFNTRASIQSYYSQLQIASKSIDTFKLDHSGNLDSYSNSTELSRLREVQRGLENQLISTINQYNANAKNLTRTYFKDWRLPESFTYSNDKLVENYKGEE